jgi:predicted metal-dependent phosphoesterase TrpH
MIKVDFHTHSTSSDGLLTPIEMVRRAYKNNVEYLAITDHDTISGLIEASDEAKKLGVNLIPGIELSTNYNGESIHILGYFRDNSYNEYEFIDYLHELKNRREIRARKMVEKLKEICNIEINIDKVIQRGKDVVARPHIAYEIIASGYPYDQDYIFDNFIGKDAPAFVPTTKLNTREGVKLLKKYNAIVILAHPKLIKNTPIEEFLDMGFDGIEAVYYQNTKEEEERLIAIAKNNNLIISVGSDCHGNFIDDNRHGDIGCMKYNEEYLEKFLHNYNK